MDIAVLTHFLSPYQVELFNAIAARTDVALRVYYLHQNHAERRWGGLERRHDALFLHDHEAMDSAMRHFQTAHLAVVNYYNESPAQKLIQARHASGLPWAFWGERPRVHRYRVASRIFRRLRLRALHQCTAPIWGIGRMAVDAYRREFGESRTYVNLPYFSNLGRFYQTDKAVANGRDQAWSILYSGSLIRRKGVDMLARVFARLAGEGVNARLKILGSGPLEDSMKSDLACCMDRVEFVGFRDWDALPSAYADADLLCAPSRYDGWGLIVPEGLAAGLPVISTQQTGAATEFVKSGANGWLIPEDHEEALYHALRQATALSRDQLNDMSRCARESVADHTLEKGAARFVDAAMAAVEAWKSCPATARP